MILILGCCLHSCYARMHMTKYEGHIAKVMEPTSYLASSKQRVESFLNKYLPKDDLHATLLDKAMRYSLLTGGKRIRASLIYSVQEPFGVNEKISDIIASSIECIHAASLVHDDLPALDNGHLRRNKDACHVMFNEATAILCGDALLMYGIDMIINITQDMLDANTVLDMSRELNKVFHKDGIIEGQLKDLNIHQTPQTLDSIESIYKSKTCLLLGVGLSVMAIAANKPHYLPSIKNFSDALGLGYQIQDDILDYEQSSSITGKPQYSDYNANKITVPSIIGIHEAKQRASYYFEQANYILNTDFKDCTQLHEIVMIIKNRQF